MKNECKIIRNSEIRSFASNYDDGINVIIEDAILDEEGKVFNIENGLLIDGGVYVGNFSVIGGINEIDSDNRKIVIQSDYNYFRYLYRIYDVIQFIDNLEYKDIEEVENFSYKVNYDKYHNENLQFILESTELLN